MQGAGWIWRGVAVWDKTEGARPQPGRFRAQCEYMIWGSRGPMPLDRDAPVLPGLFRVQPRDKGHITEKPLELMRRVVQICERGGVVLDPFAGSGSTGIAAVLEGRRAILGETHPHWAEHARERCAVDATPAADGAQLALNTGGKL
jgi:DNA modification methylase